MDSCTITRASICEVNNSVETSTEESLQYIRQSLKSDEMDHLEGTHFDRHIPHVFVILGASVSL